MYDVGYSFSVPDRNGQTNFSETEKAYVDPFTGMLKFSSAVEETIRPVDQANIKSIRYSTNFPENFVSSDTGVMNVLTGNSNNSWNLTVKSPVIINESIFSQTKYSSFKNSSANSAGAEVAIEVELTSPVLSSRIRISPNAGDGLQLTQVVIKRSQPNTNNSTSTENNYLTLLTDAVFSNKNIDVDFTEQEITGFILFFKQKKYNRTKLPPQQSELNSKLINYIVKKIREEKKQNHDTLQDYVFNFFLKDYNREFVLKNKNIYKYNYTKYYPVKKKKDQVSIFNLENKENFPSDVDAFNRYKNADMISNMVFAIVSHSLGSKIRSLRSSTYIDSTLKSAIKPIYTYTSGATIPVGDSNNINSNYHYLEDEQSTFNKADATQIMNNVEQTNMYEYMFSIKNIAIMSIRPRQTNSNRAFYASKRLPLDTRPTSVKAIYSIDSASLSTGTNSQIPGTSVEVSVSVKDNPSFESDWKPIMPYDLNQIDAELLIFTSSTQASLRFPPSAESVIIYRDGEIMPSTLYSVSGSLVNIPSRSQNSSAKYVARYRPQNLTAAKEINLVPTNLSAPVLSMSSSNGQSGEYFASVNFDLSVQLSKSPYVDRSKLLGATYNQYMGTIASANTSFGNYDYSSYSPVKVLLEDGTVAINLTNYLLTDNTAPIFPNDTDTIYFVHNDNIIIFNKKPNKPFRVLYQYLPDIFRYRIILRSLDNNQNNIFLDRVIFKFSGSKENSMMNKFIRYDNIFRNYSG